MGTFDQIDKSALARLGAGFSGMFKAAAPAAAAIPPGQMKAGIANSPEAQQLFDVKRAILQQVRAAAEANNQRPTLEQYRAASEAFTATDMGKAMAANGQWNQRIAADLSGQDLSNFTITEPKKLQQETHYLDQKPEEAADKEQTHGHFVKSGIDLHDRDGDGQINVAATHEFYDNIRFDKADLHGAWIEPATSFNEEIAQAGNLKDITFNGMSEGDVFTFRPGVFEQAHMTNITGGEIVFANHSHVAGITIEGTSAKISIGDHATVDHIAANDEFRIIKLEMGKNSVISNSDLAQSTVSMTSHFEPGATFQNVQLSGNLSGLDFSGLKLNNVSIDGRPITKPSDLDEFRIAHDANTLVTSAARHGHENHLAAIGGVLLQANKETGRALNAQEKAALEATQQHREARQHEQGHTAHLPSLGHKS